MPQPPTCHCAVHDPLAQTGVQVPERTGLPPVHPDGEEVKIVLVCWPEDGQAVGVQAEYVQLVQV